MSHDGPDQNFPNEAPPVKEERRAALDPDVHFNQQFEGKPCYLQPGEILCSDAEKDMFVSLVGSGVLVTLHDTELKLGGMCYILLPDPLLDAFPNFDKTDPKIRSATLKPIEDCIQEMKHRGAGKHRIQMRLIGGAKFPESAPQDTGTKNYIFVREYITRKGLSIFNEDLGGPYVRRVHFFPSTGRAVRIMMRRASDYAAMQDIEKKIQGKS